jgi:GNAT superfamily N-acetyltransferase
MSSRNRIMIGCLGDWLCGCTAADSATSATEGASITDKATSKVIVFRRLIAYESILSELHANPVSVKPALLEIMLADTREYVLCMWQKEALIATAQASLMFPGMRPTAHISNVVVSSSFRGQGYGGFMLAYLRRCTRQHWREYGSLRYELTSREERGTRSFYENLWYTGVTTVRYTK